MHQHRQRPRGVELDGAGAPRAAGVEAGHALSFLLAALDEGALVALVPPARLHLTSGHGVYAANAALRSVVLRQEPVPAQQPQEAPAAATRAPPKPESGGAREAEAAPEIGLGHAPGANIWGGRLEVRAMRGAPTHRGSGDESPDGRGGAAQPEGSSV